MIAEGYQKGDLTHYEVGQATEHGPTIPSGRFRKGEGGHVLGVQERHALHIPRIRRLRLLRRSLQRRQVRSRTMVSPRHSRRCHPPEPRNTRHLEKTPAVSRPSHRVHDTGREWSQARTLRSNDRLTRRTKTSRETHHRPYTRHT